MADPTREEGTWADVDAPFAGINYDAMPWTEAEAMFVNALEVFDESEEWIAGRLKSFREALRHPASRAPGAPSVDLAEFCAACGQKAHEGNSYLKPPKLNCYPKFSVCDSCLPGSMATAPLTAEMEPEEVALRCWHWGFEGACIPFDELAEQLMRWTELRAALAERAP